MKEIYCQPGKINTRLPEKAWTELGSEIQITPCDGCGHNFHNKRLAFIEREANQAKLLNLETAIENIHFVSVVQTRIAGELEEVVICSCCCAIKIKIK